MKIVNILKIKSWDEIVDYKPAGVVSWFAAEPEDRIERWRQVRRVLDSLDEHERERHWDMSTWGKLTECGTVCCAAGHCGMDSWFRERGFIFDFVQGISGPYADFYMPTPPARFFGSEGNTAIFLDPTPRPVEVVIGEVDEYIDFLEREGTDYNHRSAFKKVQRVW